MKPTAAIRTLPTLPTRLSAFLTSSLRTILTCSNHTLQEKKANALAKEAEAAKKAAAKQAKAAKNDEQKAAAAAAAKKAEDDAAGTYDCSRYVPAPMYLYGGGGWGGRTVVTGVMARPCVCILTLYPRISPARPYSRQGGRGARQGRGSRRGRRCRKGEGGRRGCCEGKGKGGGGRRGRQGG